MPTYLLTKHGERGSTVTAEITAPGIVPACNKLKWPFTEVSALVVVKGKLQLPTIRDWLPLMSQLGAFDAHIKKRGR